MFDELAARKEIADRNRLRRDSRLPLLSVEHELELMEQVYDEQQFEQFCDAHRDEVEAELLAEVRAKSGNPDWKPTGMLSGGGWWFGAQVEKKLWQMLEVRDQKHTQ